MEPRTGTTRIENPVCTTDRKLPPPPSIGELIDPAEPHPDEPGAPADAPPPRALDESDDRTRGEPLI
jgi:hypothetical protein